jgi:hypothetical protein
VRPSGGCTWWTSTGTHPTMTYHSRACRARGATAALRPRHRGSSVVRQPRPPRVHLGLLVLPRQLWLLPRRQRLCLSRALARHPRRRRGCQRRSPLGTEDARRPCLPRRPVAHWLAAPRDGTTPWPWRTMSQWPKPHRADHCGIHLLYIVCCRTRRAHPVALLQGRMCVRMCARNAFTRSPTRRTSKRER